MTAQSRILVAPSRTVPGAGIVAVALALALLLAGLGIGAGRAGAATSPKVPARSTAELSMIKAVFSELNKERAAHHLTALKLNSKLQLSARRHDVTMRARNTLSHQLPGEPAFDVRESQAGYKWWWAGENIAYSTSMSTAGVLGVQRQMYGEKPPNDGHRVNILSKHFKDVGVDVLLDPTHHKVWLTTDFGSLN